LEINQGYTTMLHCQPIIKFVYNSYKTSLFSLRLQIRNTNICCKSKTKDRKYIVKNLTFCYQSQAPTLPTFQITEHVLYTLTFKWMNIFLLESKLGFRNNVAEDLVSLACDAGSLVRLLPTFRDYLVVSFSGGLNFRVEHFSVIPIAENLHMATKTLSRSVGKEISRFLSQCNGKFLLLFLPQYCRSVCYG